MLRKVKITKATILLIVSFMIAISVCFSTVYAWFLHSTKAGASISGKVVDFRFTTNGKFQEKVEITAGETIGNQTFTYKYPEVNGMFPGQAITAKLYLSNKESDLGARYKIFYKDSNTDAFPKDCLLEVKDSNNSTVLAPALISSVNQIYPGNGEYRELEAGASEELTLILTWPREYEDIPSGITVPGYTDATAKNAGDMEYLKSCRAHKNGEKDFSVTFEVVAEQTN